MKNNKGFTLIELLAVITIMGILMIVAIGSVNRIIENSRRDTFATTAKEYINAVRNGVVGDTIVCGGVSASATPDGTYYFPIDTTTDATKDLMQSGGKSPFGNSEMKGYVKWVKSTDDSDPKNPKTDIDYTIRLTDTGKHGFNKDLTESDLRRVNVSTKTDAVASTTLSGATACEMN